MSTPLEQSGIRPHAQELAAAIEKLPEVQRPPTDAQEGFEQFAKRSALLDKFESGPEKGDAAKKTEASPDKKPVESRQDSKSPDAEGKQSAPDDAQRQQQQTQQQPKTQQQLEIEGRERLFERAAKEPEFDKFVQNYLEPPFPNSPEGQARYWQGMARAIVEISNGDDVIHYLCRPENASIVFNMQNASPQKIYQTMHMISAELRFGMKYAKGAETEKRQPIKAPREVGGRNAAPADGARLAAEEGNFGAFDKEMKQRYSRR